MSDQLTRPLVACVNSSEDIVLMLAEHLRMKGVRTVTHVTPVRWGSEPVIEFLVNLRPDVCLYAVSIPYDANWRELEALRAVVPEVPFVVTTTNKRALDELVGPTDSIEMIGKPDDLAEVVAAVRQALGSGHARWD